MDTAGSEEQLDVLAATVKGELTWAPFAGAETVMADAETDPARRARIQKDKFFTE
jgi:hypothetical protein